MQLSNARAFGGTMSEMSLKLIAKPETRPVTLVEAKSHVRQEETTDDALIRTLIDAATLRAENFTRRQFITATYEMRFDCFPYGFEFPRAPLQSVESIKYIDVNEAEQTFDSAKYSVDTFRTIGRAVLKSGESWPSVFDDINVVRVQFVAGYGDDPDDIPQDIRAAIKLILGHLYEHRETVIIGKTATEIPEAAKSLLWSYRLTSIG